MRFRRHVTATARTMTAQETCAEDRSRRQHMSRTTESLDPPTTPRMLRVGSVTAWRKLSPSTLRRRRTTVAVLAAGVVALTGSTLAVADSLAPATTAVMYACVNATTKVLTQSTATATCPSGGNKIHWNQAGPQGPKGATGATGAQGPAGLAVGYFGSNSFNVPLSGSDPNNQYLAVSTHPVSKTGTYFITAAAEVSTDSIGVFCDVGTDNGGPAGDDLTGGGNGGSLTQASVTDSIHVIAGDAPALWCFQDSNSANLSVLHSALTAILMNSVNT